MIKKLIAILETEIKQLGEIILLAKRQQKALVNYDVIELGLIATGQEELIKKLKETEEFRIKLLISWLGITKKDALSLKLSKIEEQLKSEAYEIIKNLRQILNQKLFVLINLNSTNRALANRAQSSINQIISILTSGTNHVCNVRI